MGNFADYLAQRKVEEKTVASRKEIMSSVQWKANRPQKLKFSFKEQREYETIDADIAALEAEIAHCDEQIAESVSDYLRLQELDAEKQQLSAELDGKMERWVYLNDLAERIAAQDNAQ